MEQDFLGLSSDFKRIRPSTLQALTLPENIVSSIKSFMNEIKQKQQEEKNPKSTPTKSKPGSKPSSQKKPHQRKCTLLLRGSSIVKKVLLEKVSCPKNQKRPFNMNLKLGPVDSEGVDFEFISTPFNEEIPPVKIAKLEKYYSATLRKEQTPAQPQPQIQTSAQTQAQAQAQAQAQSQKHSQVQAQNQAQIQARPFMKPPQPSPFHVFGDMPYFYNFPKGMMRMPMDPQGFPVQDKQQLTKENMFWMGGGVPPVRDNMSLAMNPAMNMGMGMGMGMFPQPPVLMTKPPTHNQTFLDLS